MSTTRTVLRVCHASYLLHFDFTTSLLIFTALVNIRRLVRHGQPGELAYACCTRAEELLKGTGSTQLETVQPARHKLEVQLGKNTPRNQSKLSALLAAASSLPTTSF